MYCDVYNGAPSWHQDFLDKQLEVMPKDPLGEILNQTQNTKIKLLLHKSTSYQLDYTVSVKTKIETK